MTNSFAPLPALRSLGDLADRVPTNYPADFSGDVTILIDTREQRPLVDWTLPHERKTIHTGDYSARVGAVELTDRFIVERKSLDDLTACCKSVRNNDGNRERLEREFVRMVECQRAMLTGPPPHGFLHALLIIGTTEDIERGYYVSDINPRSVKASIKAWRCRYNLEVVYAPNTRFAAAWVELWAVWMARAWKRGSKKGEVTT